jgi:DNA-binding response OmpR family regulator
MASIGRVLLIDDEDILRKTLTRVLENAGCEVISAPNGLDGLKNFSNTDVDLVYLDIRLPDMDGLEVLQRIRKIDTQLPVILFTGHATLKTALDAIRLGASDYLVKPIDPEVFIARTRVILDEQAVERRRRDLQEQIAALQVELGDLDVKPTLAPSNPLRSSFSEERFIKKGHFVLDLQAQRATLADRVLSLPPTAFEYLTILVRHAPEAVDYQTLAAEAQGYEVAQAEASELAKYHIHVLRQALGVKRQQPGYILNKRGHGYRILTD